MSADIMSKTAADIMIESPLTISSDMFAAEALGFMNNNPKNANISILFVVSDTGTAEGLLALHHCLSAGVA
jgi:CBS domain-containing protein